MSEAWEAVGGGRIVDIKRVDLHRVSRYLSKCLTKQMINAGVRSPETVNDLVTHYVQHELTLERKAYATVAVYNSFLNLYVLPKWKDHKISDVKTLPSRNGLTVSTLHLVRERSFATSCPRSTVMASGTSGSP
ncbi:MAG: hypothetical protein WA869_16760 [Alloacidobacterium sp.]